MCEMLITNDPTIHPRMFSDSSKTLKDVLSEFEEGGLLSNYNSDEVSDVQGSFVTKVYFAI